MAIVCPCPPLPAAPPNKWGAAGAQSASRPRLNSGRRHALPGTTPSPQGVVAALPPANGRPCPAAALPGRPWNIIQGEHHDLSRSHRDRYRPDRLGHPERRTRAAGQGSGSEASPRPRALLRLHRQLRPHGRTLGRPQLDGLCQACDLAVRRCLRHSTSAASTRITSPASSPRHKRVLRTGASNRSAASMRAKSALSARPAQPRTDAALQTCHSQRKEEVHARQC